MVATPTIELAGTVFESANTLKTRLNLGENRLYVLMKDRTFPKALRMSRTRYFDPREVDAWFLSTRR
jgi:predicted DNA-binding transcriptional regulator AlpA